MPVKSTHAMVLAAQAAGVLGEGSMEKAGTDSDTLRDPEARIPGSTVFATWDDLRKAAGAPLSYAYGAREALFAQV